MRKTIAIASAVGLCVGCVPRASTHAPSPVAASAESCAKTAELMAERQGLLNDMHLTARERAQFERSRVRSSQPVLGNGASAGSLAATSLGSVQGITSGGQVARGNPVSSNPVYMRQTAYTSSREMLLLRLRVVDDKLGKLPTPEACQAAHLTE